jgi:hypothetical protein
MPEISGTELELDFTEEEMEAHEQADRDYDTWLDFIHDQF